MLHGAGMIDHHLEGSPLAVAGNARQATAEHANAVAQQTAVRRVVNVALDDRRVGPEFAASGDPSSSILPYWNRRLRVFR